MNETTLSRLARLGVHVPRLLVPNHDVDLFRWAVIACDQHTSEPDYWEEVTDVAGTAPSTLNLVFPEVYLGGPDVAGRIESIHKTMRTYLANGVVRELEPGFALTERGTPHVSGRHGLVLALDLDEYDFNPGADSIVRATEQTIVERLPTRIDVRRGAPMEFPHVLVLIDDPDDLVFGSMSDADHEQLYSTELMLGGGSITGYHIVGDAVTRVADALESLFNRSRDKRPFLFAVGDGNHSLAAAKQVWEELKPTAAPDHPARYALVEVVNLYDPGLRFEPIHRLVETHNATGWLDTFTADTGAQQSECPVDELRDRLRQSSGAIGYVCGTRSGLIRLRNTRELPVTTVQSYLNRQQGLKVDYIHGWDTSVQLGAKKDAVALLMPEINPAMIFPTVTSRGVLPRKAFSLGEAEEKRYYLEGRLIER